MSPADQDVLAGDDVRPQRAAEEERRAGDVLADADREAALERDDRRHRPAAEQRAADAGC